MISPSELPRNIIVPAGNWEPATVHSSHPQLSKETIMRVNAVAVLAMTNEPSSVIFSGGLVAGGRTEAKAMDDHFMQHYTAANSLTTTYIDENCHNTTTSARSVAQLVEAYEIEGDFTLIASKTFLPRAAKSFERYGFKGRLVPVSAEELLLHGTQAQRAHAEAFVASSRYKKRVAAEWLLRGVHALDPGDRIIEWSSGLVRPNKNRV